MPDRVDETLTAIETEAWMTATNEANRQHGPARRQQLATMIRQKLVAMNRKALDEALSLGVSFDNVAQHQRLRRGVRAIMLAQFALKGVPLREASSLKQKWLNQPEDVIRRGLLACFPAINDMNNPDRQAWLPIHFTDPKAFPKWSAMQPLTSTYRFIVTCLPPDDRAQATLDNPDGTIASWDAISTSVIDQSNSIIYGYYGFVLSVPAENILIANSSDQDLLNHLGTAMTRSPEHEANLSPLVKGAMLSQHLSDLFAEQGRLKSPLECIQQNRNGRWNEVVLAGRSPNSGRPTRVSALFYRVASNHQYFVAKNSTKSPITKQIEEWVEACSDWNDLPIIYIPDSSGRLG